MVLMPVLGNIHTAADPNVIEGFDVVQEAGQGGGAPRLADEAAVQPDGHHLGGPRKPFGAEEVEGVLVDVGEGGMGWLGPVRVVDGMIWSRGHPLGQTELEEVYPWVAYL